METRRHSREWAIQLLFQLDVNPGEPEEAFRHFWAGRDVSEKARRFAEDIVLGVRSNAGAIDEIIRKSARNWDIRRMGVIERNVMRMAVYEMHFKDDVPPVVSINEAVDIAKYFSSTESGKFVNGILDRIRKDLARPPRTGAQGASRTGSDEK